jgi:hypothetical protein
MPSLIASHQNCTTNMPIAFRFNDVVEITGRGGDYLVICDHCGEEIPQDGSHNIESGVGSPGDIVPVQFLHLDCIYPAQIARGGRGLWRKLTAVKIETA